MNQLQGFSQKINDPSYTVFQQKSDKWAIGFAVFLAIAAIIGFPIYGQVSGELELSQSLLYGALIGGMFLIIAFAQTLKKKKDTTWDGEVTNKRSYRRQNNNDPNNVSISYYTVYEYKVRRDNGKIYTHRNNDNDAIYNYYNIGDKVRHHKGFYIYEKYDKSNDEYIFCIACGTRNPIENTHCRKCKVPLLLA